LREAETSKYSEPIPFFTGAKMTLSQLELEDLFRRAVSLYNKYRSPEATAKLVSLSPKNVIIAFSGAFCYSCGVLDYIEDFIYEFKTLTDKVKLKIGKKRQTSSGTFMVDYKIKFR
jgi:hypothetical protein